MNKTAAFLLVTSVLATHPLQAQTKKAPGEADPNYTGPSAPTVLLPALVLPDTKAFVHPGLLQSQADLDFVRARLQAHEEPWTSALRAMEADPFCSKSRKPRALPEPVAGANSSGAPMMDGSTAYGAALLWCLTGDKGYADQAISILNANARTLRTMSGPSDGGRLLAAFTGGKFASAAELLVSYRQPDGSTANWAPQDVEACRRMLKTVFYPLVADFKPEFNGNWDASMVNTMMCIAVFCDDHAMFNRAVDYYLHGAGHGSISHYIYASGECQETMRDQSHVQLGLGALASACEVAEQQGLDLFSMADNRLAVGYEYTARYNLGNEVQTLDNVPPGPKGRGRWMPGYEIIYQHYAIDKGIPMPFTQQVLAKHRPEGMDLIMLPAWGTLVSYRGPATPATTPSPIKP